MAEEEQIKMVNEAELDLTDEEASRNELRGLCDVAKMIMNGIPKNIAQVIASVRYDQRVAYGVRALYVNDVMTPCLLVEVMPGQTACLALIHDGFTLKTHDGEDMKEKGSIQQFEKRTLN